MAFVSCSPRFLPKHLAAATAAISLVAAPVCAHAQTAAPAAQTVAYSSSSNAQGPYAGEDIDGSSLGSAPDGSNRTMKTVAPQYGGGYGGGSYHRYDNNSRFSHFSFEVGGGLTAPIGNTTSGGFTSIIGDGNNYGTQTYGGNILVGAGYSFSKRFTLLGEFSYNDDKIPGRTLSAFYNALGDGTTLTDANGNTIASIGGNVHTFGYTAEPVFTYLRSDKHGYEGYVLGGVGFYHKSLNFSAPEIEEDLFGDEFETNQTFSSYSDNGVGFNLGTGVSFKPFGEYSGVKFFAEARYVFVDTPSESAADIANPTSFIAHTGTEELIPVTFGIRF